MSELEYEFLGYVVRADKCDIRIEKRFDNECDAMEFANKKAEFGFTVCLERVSRAVNWRQ